MLLTILQQLLFFQAFFQVMWQPAYTITKYLTQGEQKQTISEQLVENLDAPFE